MVVLDLAPETTKGIGGTLKLPGVPLLLVAQMRCHPPAPDWSNRR